MIKKLSVVLFLFASFFVFADEAVLIDFSKLSADTAIDFSSYATGFTLTNPKVSLEAKNWNVDFNASANTLEASIKSYTLPASSKANGTVLGVRAFFPSTPAHAFVLPPYQIPAYSSVDFSGNGVLRNVGTIKEVKVTVYGHNVDYRFYIVLQDQTGKTWDVDMGSLQFTGWRELVWTNAGYIADVRDREITVTPSYPGNMTYVRLVGFKITKSMSSPGGDFITYIKSVSMIYDKASLDTDTDIDDEAIWSLSKEKKNESDLELQRAASLLYLREQEALLMTK